LKATFEQRRQHVDKIADISRTLSRMHYDIIIDHTK